MLKPFRFIILMVLPVFLLGMGPLFSQLDEIRISPKRGFAPLRIEFQWVPPFGQSDPVLPEWHFGDGTEPHSGTSVSHRYSEPGIYTVRMMQDDRELIRTVRVLQFDTPDILVVSDHPVAIATADFDEDGHTELVIANELDHLITVYHNDGTRAQIPVGIFPLSLDASDINGDGHTDVAVANGGSGDVTLLYGNGRGEFVEIISLPVGPFPNSVVATDFNQDGLMDLAVAFDSNKVKTFLSDQFGNFRPALTQSLPLGPGVLDVADLDQDGLPDLISANRDSNNVSILYGDGTGGFSDIENLAVGLGPKALTLADFDEDGWMDVAVANWIQNSISILSNDSRGRLYESNTLRALAGPFNVKHGDLDGDDILDLVVANLEGQAVAVYLGEGQGEFALPVNLPVPMQPVGLAVVDLDLDGALDIAVTSLSDDSFILFRNQLLFIDRN